MFAPDGRILQATLAPEELSAAASRYDDPVDNLMASTDCLHTVFSRTICITARGVRCILLKTTREYSIFEIRIMVLTLQH